MSSAVSDYQEPEGFRIAINACIQSLRNVTFALQSQKHDIENFDVWYESWRQALKTDIVMRWCVEARNTIVKQQDLETNSVCLASLSFDYGEPIQNKLPVPPFSTAQQIALLIKPTLPDKLQDYGYLNVERRWTVNGLEDIELLEALAYALNVLRTLIFDFQLQAGPHTFYKDREDSGTAPSIVDGFIDEEMLPQFARTFREARTATLKLSSSEFVRIAESEHPKIDIDAGKKASIQYELSTIRGLEQKNNLKSELDYFLEIGKRILQTDGYHSPKAILLGKKASIVEPDYPEHEDKPTMWRHVAKIAKRLRAKRVIIIAEAWSARPDSIPDGGRPENSLERIEVLNGAALSDRGESYIISIPFIREGRSITFDEPMIVSDAHFGPLEPFRKIWRKTIKNREKTRNRNP